MLRKAHGVTLLAAGRMCPAASYKRVATSMPYWCSAALGLASPDLSAFTWIFCLPLAAQLNDQQSGAWRAIESCAHDAGNFGRTGALGQSNPNLDVILIFQDSLIVRATVRNCAQEATRVSYRLARRNGGSCPQSDIAALFQGDR